MEEHKQKMEFKCDVTIKLIDLFLNAVVFQTHFLSDQVQFMSRISLFDYLVRQKFVCFDEQWSRVSISFLFITKVNLYLKIQKIVLNQASKKKSNDSI